MAEAFTTQDKKVKERPARKKLKFFAHYEPAELALMEQLYSSTLNEITEDEIIKGRIVSISNKDVTIDVGFKSEGIVSLLEFRAEDEVNIIPSGIFIFFCSINLIVRAQTKFPPAESPIKITFLG